MAFGLKLAGTLLAAWLLVCSFPLPPGLRGMEGAGAAWMALIPLLLIAQGCRPGAAFGWGWLCGFIFWLMALVWLLQLRHTWGNLPLPLLSWVGLAAYCALYMGLFAALFAAVSPGAGCGFPAVGLAGHLLQVLAAPVFWIGTEMLRATLFTGFPWNLLGVSQYRNIAMIQLASVGGVYAVSGLIVLLNAALAITMLRIFRETLGQVRRGRVHVELMAGLLAVAFCWSWGMRTVRHAYKDRTDGLRVRVAAVQPAIPQVLKWSAVHERDIYTALHEQTTLAVMSRPDLVVWPETATPGMLRFDPISRGMAEALAAEGVYLLIGSMDRQKADDDSQEEHYTNASFLMAPSGSLTAAYHKHHLVLFGEYLPFESRFPFLGRFAPLGFSCVPGGADQPLMELPVGGGGEVPSGTVRFATLICFEDVFPYLARRATRRGARLLINQTNNAWFDGSSASRQHLANAVLRTVENRLPMVRSANTGVTCFIDRFGRITEKFVTRDEDIGLRGFAVAEVRTPAADMPLRLYTRYGDWLLGWPCVILSVGAALWRVVQMLATRLKRLNPLKDMCLHIKHPVKSGKT